jgi:predicted acyl esterase
LRHATQRLSNISPELERLLTRGDLFPPQFAVSDIKCETVMVPMRDGVRLATDVYKPPSRPAQVIAMRTPYGRAADGTVGAFLTFARRGYIVVSQDCRGTGESEPDSWDYYMYESEDGHELIEWIAQQEWFGGFIGSCGGSYLGQTQWCMATHPAMSAIVPTVSGLGIATNTAHLYMFLNAYARSVGKGTGKVGVSIYDMERLFEKETLAGGYFNEPLYKPLSEAVRKRFPRVDSLPISEAKRWLWEYYCTLTGAQRSEFVKQALGIESVTSIDVESLPAIFGYQISHDAHTIPHVSPPDLCRLIQAPPLLLTSWYDWCLNDALATWGLFRQEAKPSVAKRTRMIITPHAHNMPGYYEGVDTHPELIRLPSTANYAGILMRWYEAVREGKTDQWPTVIYYLMGANEWRVAADWPVPEARQAALYLGNAGALGSQAPRSPSQPDCYTFNPNDPTPTVGGSIVSFLYSPGSVDVSGVQKRGDVLVYTTELLEHDVDVVGPLRMILYASSSAVDTDFVARLSDVFPDGRAIQLQNGILRARYRSPDGEPELLEPHRIYRFEIDMWATASRFKAGHRLRLDISSADFPRFDRNSNRGGDPGDPTPALQKIYHDQEHPSHLVLSVLGDCSFPNMRT